jgi:glycosyltransferase involved in cell wall biosynthesis
MKVAFDVSTAAFKQKTGTGVYVEELVQNYQSLFQQDEITHSYRLARRLRGKDFLLPLSPNSSQETILDPWTCLNGFRHDVFHGLNSRLPVFVGPCKMVATIHDLFSIFGSFSDDRFREDQSKKLKKMIARADHIIVPASFTRDELIKHFNLSREKITVIPQGVRSTFLKPRDRAKSQSAVAAQYGLIKPFLLFVGTLEKRKNLIGLVKTYGRLSVLKKDLPDLVLVGHEGYLYSEIAQEIESSGLKDKIKILGFISEENLGDLYSACEAFIYLSLEEGFGIPIIEAMACGAPVVSSNTTSLPEAGGGHTWLVSPHDHEIAALAVLDILRRTESTRAQIERGTCYARSETWGKVAARTRDVFISVKK